VAASAEVGARAGRVHDEVARVQQQWRDLLGQEARAAADKGQLAKDTDPAQLAFELGVILAGTNIVSVLHDDTGAITRSQAAVRSRLSRLLSATGAQGQIATRSQRNVGVWPLFVGVSFAGRGAPVGHNRTRPPPCMRWRGPCSAYRSRRAGLPGSTGSGGPTAGPSHPRPVPATRFLLRPRGFPWGGVRFRRDSISTP
jgi:hypothetical protein